MPKRGNTTRLPKPLTDEEGEVRELTLRDIRRFRPMAEGIPPSLAAKLGIQIPAKDSLIESSASAEKTKTEPVKRRKSGIPTGNAGEYFVMGELLRRGFDAQLADRNTKGYDLLVGRPDDLTLRKVQVKSVRQQPWYVNTHDFEGQALDQATVYVLVGPEDGAKPIRFFIAKNRDLATHVHRPSGWRNHGFMNIRALEKYENRWDLLMRDK